MKKPIGNNQTVKSNKIGIIIASLMTLVLLVVTATLNYKYNSFEQQSLPALDPTEPWTKPDLSLLSPLSMVDVKTLLLCIFLAIATIFGVLGFVPKTKYRATKPVLVTINIAISTLAFATFISNGNSLAPTDKQIEATATQTNQWVKDRYNVDLKQNFSDKDIWDLTQAPADPDNNVKTIVNIKGDSVKALHKDKQMILIEINNQDKTTELPVITK